MWYVDELPCEVPYSRIESMANEGKFHEWNFYPFDFIENGYEGVIDKLKTYKATDYLGADKETQDRMVAEVLQIYRDVDVFPIQYYSDMGVINEIEKCISYPAKFDGDTVSCGAGVGTTLCNYLFPNIFDTPSKHDLDKKGAETLYAKFHNDEYLGRAIRFCFSYKDGCPTPTNVMGGLRLVGSAPTNFRPMNAKAVYERFCPEGGTIYDFCCGFGGRMLGALSSRKNFKYVGTDPNVETMYHLHQLGELIESTTGRENSYELHSCVDDDTEFFDGFKWKSIKEYNDGDKVLQYNEDGTASLVKPLKYIHYESDEPFYEYTGKMFNSCLTGNHNVVYRKRIGNSSDLTDKVFKIKQSEIVDKDFGGRIPLSFSYSGDIEVNEELIRFAVALQADGCIDNGNTGRVHFSFSKGRKIYRMYFLLGTFGIPYTALKVTINGKQGVRFYLNWKKLTDIFGGNKDKIFPSSWYHLTENSKRIFLDEVFHWDGSIDSNSKRSDAYSYSTTCKENADLVQFLIASSSMGAGMVFYTDRKPSFGCENPKDVYKVVQRLRGGYSAYRGHVNKYSKVYKSHKYCFTVPSHMLVLRRRGEIFITGNCGSEEFRGKPNSIDFAFSSPPYFDLEVYSDDPTQCYNKFPELSQWLEGYVRATIKNIFYMLKPGSCYAVNIADFKVGSNGVCAYVDEWIRLSTEEGMPLFDTVYLGVTARAGSKEQAAGELKKENILIFKKPLI